MLYNETKTNMRFLAFTMLMYVPFTRVTTHYGLGTALAAWHYTQRPQAEPFYVYCKTMVARHYTHRPWAM